MSTSTSPNPNKLIHVGRIVGNKRLFLRKKDPLVYHWYEQDGEGEKETNIFATNPEEAIRLAFREWKMHAFESLPCGYLYTLPERDEHGVNALFYQMVASYRSPTGVYFDEERGHNCFVDNAPQQALKYWKQLEQAGKL